MPSSSITLRHATAADAAALRRLAALDSRALPAGPLLVAEVGDELQAALSLSDGAAIADPFRRTAELVDLLRAHAAARAATERRRRLSLGRRLRPAFGL